MPTKTHTGKGLPALAGILALAPSAGAYAAATKVEGVLSADYSLYASWKGFVTELPG